jgi:colanic acid/amylovoran biosynthesis glycosyltransferase
VSDKVDFLGVLTPDQVKKEMEDALAFVQHSVRVDNGDMEGCPVAILEAQASALPVISTIHAGIPDVVIPNETGLLVEEHDCDGMARAMEYLLEYPDKAANMGRSGRVRVQSNFTMDIYLNKLRKIIEMVE